jgi:DNA-binding IclR family transcriptional regulator
MVVKEEDGTIRAGTKFLEIGERVRRQHELYQAGQSEIKNLALETGEHAGLMIEENGIGVLLYVEKGDKAVDLQAWSGRRIELPTNAAGKTILAHLPAERVHEILDEHGMPAYTPNTITDRDTLMEELADIRNRGYGTETGELVEGVRALAAPVISHGQIKGSVAVGGPGNRMRGDRFETELPDKLLRASNVVELDISYG